MDDGNSSENVTLKGIRVVSNIVIVPLKMSTVMEFHQS